MLNEQVMPIVDVAPWALVLIVESFVAWLLVVRGFLQRFLFLALYLMLSVSSSVGRYVILSHFGLDSNAYCSFYFYSDAVLTIVLFLAICELGLRLMGDKKFRRRAVLLSACVLGGTVLLSFLWMPHNGSDIATTLALEVSQNLFFVCGAALVVIWGWKMKNQPDDYIANRFVSVLSVYFVLYFLLYGMVQSTRQDLDFRILSSMMWAWLPFGCGFAVLSQD